MRVKQHQQQGWRRLKQYLYEQHSSFHHLEHLPGPRVLVLSPHPDDDIFGCGGALVRHLQVGHSIRIVYLCKGERGIQGISHQEATRIRQQEATEAATMLGINAENLSFLNQPDEKLQADSVVIDQLNHIIATHQPNIIYLPSFLDHHRDHRAANQILKEVELASKVLIGGFEVWTPITPNRLIDITPVIEIKKEAMRKHRSQLERLNYYEAILALNQYRACLYPKRPFEYAEAFILLPKSDYVKYID